MGQSCPACEEGHFVNNFEIVNVDSGYTVLKDVTQLQCQILESVYGYNV